MSFRRPNGHVEQMSRCFDWIDLKRRVSLRDVLDSCYHKRVKGKDICKKTCEEEILNFEFYQLQLFFADRWGNVKVISTKGDWDRNMGQRIA